MGTGMGTGTGTGTRDETDVRNGQTLETPTSTLDGEGRFLSNDLERSRTVLTRRGHDDERRRGLGTCQWVLGMVEGQLT